MDKKTFCIGISLGQFTQHTALVVLEVIYRQDGCHCILEMMERIPGSSPSDAIAARLETVYKKLKKLNWEDNTVMCGIDITGVGESMVRLIKNAGVRVDAEILITSGSDIQKNEKNPLKWHIPKKDLISILKVAWDARRIKIADGLADFPIILKELQDPGLVKVRLKSNPADIEESWREKPSDDYVFALAAGVWTAERRRPVAFKAVSRGTYKDVGSWRKNPGLSPGHIGPFR